MTDTLFYYMNILSQTSQLHTWRDYVECIILMITCYKTLNWLARDATHTLITLVSFWCVAFAVTYILQLEVLASCMVLTLPVALVALLLFHPEKLQKNFVLYKTATVPQNTVDWPAHLIRSLLHATNRNHHVMYMIERRDSLANQFMCRHPLHTPITTLTLDMIVETTPLDQTCATWVTWEGMIQGTDIISYHELEWLELALAITQHADTIFIQNNCIEHSFELIVQGKHIPHLSADRTLHILKQFLLRKEQGMAYDFSSDSFTQSSPHA